MTRKEIRAMGNISIRKLDEGTLTALKFRAAKHGVSMEEEVRQILKTAVAAPERITDIARRYFGPEHGIDLELPERETHEPIDFSE